MAQCAKFDASALESNFSCLVEDETGAQLPSFCSQRFASSAGQILDFAIIEVEDDAAKAVRYQKREQQERMDAALETKAELDAAIEEVRVQKDSIDKKISFETPAELKLEAERLASQFAELTHSVELPDTASADLNISVGPTFDCQKAQTPIEKAICSDADLKRLDVEVYQPVYLLRHLFPDRRENLKQESIAFSRQVQKRCKLEGKPTNASIEKAVPCLIEAYQRQREVWHKAARGDIAGNAGEELSRSVDEHVRLQAALQRAGYLPENDLIDGVYGGGTRAAISQFQIQQGLPSDGILSSLTAERLDRATSVSALGSAQGHAALNGLYDLGRDYRRLEVRFAAFEEQRKRSEDLRAKIAFARAFATQALQAELPTDLRDDLTRFLEAATVSDTLGDHELSELAAAFDALQPAAESAIAVTKATTPKTSFIVLGPLDDVLVLYNDTGKAPSIVRNLRGELVFEGGRAKGCQAGKGVDDRPLQKEINRRLEQWDQRLSFPLPACNLAALNSYDVLLFERGEFLKQRSADAISFLQAAEAGDIAQMALITAAEVKSAVQAEAARVLDIEIGVDKGSKIGSGIVVLPATDSGVLCNTTREDTEAHGALLTSSIDWISEEVQQEATLVTMSVEAAFVAVKRGQCGAIYGDSKDLKDITTALRRDGIDFRYVAFWIDPERLKESRQKIDAAVAEEARQEADRRRQVEDDQKLTAAKAAEEQELRMRRQAELRAQYGAMARAFEGSLQREMKEFVELRDSPVEEKYPDLAQWYFQQLNDQWELATVETNLLDYGTAEFKGRILEAGLATTQIKMRNRILGEYSNSCFVTGFIADTEFAVDRDPLAIACDENGAEVLRYKQARNFSSRWTP